MATNEPLVFTRRKAHTGKSTQCLFECVAGLKQGKNRWIGVVAEKETGPSMRRYFLSKIRW